VRDVDALAAELHARGLRVTQQRQLIYSLLAEKPSHPTVETVHEAVLAVLPTVSLRTVYQALHDLEAIGEIRLVHVGNGPLRVDTRPERHDHLHCTQCGRLHDVDVDALRTQLHRIRALEIRVGHASGRENFDILAA
jgi:Fe2+ or Zn2+ uptake regulation protein